MSRKRPRVKRDEPVSEEKEQEKEDYDAFGFMKDKKQIGVAGAFFAFGFLIAAFMSPQITGMIVTNSGNAGSGNAASSESVGMDTVSYINDNLLREGFTAILESADEKSGMYEVSVDIAEDGSDTSQNVVFYVSSDGKNLFFSEPIDMTVPVEVPDETQDTQDTTPAESVPKSDKPVANVFVMSYCPYGLQMQKALLPVMELLGDKADININFVNYIMHGEKELVQNNREYCIEKDQPEVFTDYLRCFVQSDDHATCMTEAGVDQAKLDSCLAELETEFDVTNVFESSTSNYPPYPVDDSLNQMYGVRGSPTFVLNGVTQSVARSPEAIKQLICSSFNEAPEECSQTLSSTQESPGIGALGSGTASATAATCG